MLEPIQGEAGVILTTRELMRGQRSRCNEHGLLMILDCKPAAAGQERKPWLLPEKRGKEGLLLNATRPHLLRFMPALNANSSEIFEGRQ